MLVGEHIKLRPVEESDLTLLVEWRNNPAIWASFFNKFPLSHTGQRGWYKAVSEDRSRLFLMIQALDSKEAIGTIGFDRIDPVNQVAEYGNALIALERFKGKGLAREATMLLLEYGFARLNLNRIFLHVLVDNEPATRLYRRCGFREEGQLRQAFYDAGTFKDIMVMGLLKSEYLEQIKAIKKAVPATELRRETPLHFLT